MIEKRAEYISGENGNEAFSILDEGSSALEKTASVYDPAVAEYLERLDRQEGYIYALINALTAGEYFGPNRNGDFFPEQALKKYHNTFVDNGHVYKHHQNKDPKKSMGKVVFSHYNPKMKRVEIVVKLKKEHPDVEKIMAELAQGRIPKTSMGCFTAGTPVTLANGTTKAIEEIQLGDEVRTHLGNSKKVTKLTPRSYVGGMTSIKTRHSLDFLECTKEHPVFILQKEAFTEETLPEIPIESGLWAKAEDVVPGDLIISPITAKSSQSPYRLKNGTGYLVTSVNSFSYKGAVFNFEVEGDNSYLVGNSGYAVHNCKVPYDLCSITNKRAKTRAEYSEYLKYKMGKTLDDGRRVYAINETPKFFDISIVTIPADPTSAFMLPIGLSKTAEAQDAPALEKVAHVEESKQAAMTKKLPAELEAIDEDPKRLIVESQEKLTDEQVAKLAEYPMEQVMSTMLALRVMPTREDFQKLALYKAGKKDLADQLQKEGTFFEITQETKVPEIKNVGPEQVNEKIAEVFSENISKISLTKPLIISRILEKTADLVDVNINAPFPNAKPKAQSFIKGLFFDDEPKPADSGVKDPTTAFMAIGTLYAGYARLFKESASLNNFSKFIGRNPWVGPLIGLGVGVAATKQQESILEPVNNKLYKTASNMVQRTMGQFLVAAPISYYQSAKMEAKARTGQPLSNTEDFVRRNPFLTAAGGTMAWKGIATPFGKTLSRWTGKSKKGVTEAAKKSGNRQSPIFGKTASTRAEYLDSLSPETVNSIYNEVIS